MNLLLALCLVAVVAAAPPPSIKYSKDDVQVLRYENYNIGVGNHRYAYETSDGTKQEQQGELKNEDSEDAYYSFRGSFEWISPVGIRYVVNYVADKNGYQPEYEEGPGNVPPALMALMLGAGK